MDLRKKKTLRSISNAFLQLRAKKPLEKISVKELAELAEISKATFYLHYKDIYELSEHLQAEAVTSIFNNMPHPEAVRTDPGTFTRELFLALLSQRTLTNILFSGNQEPLLPKAIEQEIRSHLQNLDPDFQTDVKSNILLTYQVQGGFNAYKENIAFFSSDDILNAISEATTALASIMK